MQEWISYLLKKFEIGASVLAYNQVDQLIVTNKTNHFFTIKDGTQDLERFTDISL